jgi:hypothetical protein
MGATAFLRVASRLLKAQAGLDGVVSLGRPHSVQHGLLLVAEAGEVGLLRDPLRCSL